MEPAEEQLRAAVALFMKAHNAQYMFYGSELYHYSTWDACITTSAPPPFNVHDFKKLLSTYCARQMLETSSQQYAFLISLRR